VGSILFEFNPQGELVFATYMLGVTYDITLDAARNIFVTGTTVVTTGTAKVLVAEVDPAGSKVLYSQTFGGSGGPIWLSDMPRKVAVDRQGNIYVAGFTESVDFPVTPGAIQTKRLELRPYRVLRLPPDGLHRQAQPENVPDGLRHLPRRLSDRGRQGSSRRC